MKSPVASATMVGRDRELQELRRGFRETLDGIPRAVVVAGEAGIGKTRLLAAFQDEASVDARILFGQCVDLGAGAVPYAPITAVLRSLVRQVGADAVLTAAGPGRGALTLLLPELADGPVDPAQAGVERLHEVVAVLLESFAREMPVVVVIEDLHWVDGATLTVLRFLLRALAAGRILLVLSYRTEDVHRGHPLRDFLSEAERARLTTRIDLHRLTLDEVNQQATAILGRAPETSTLLSVFERSEGVPFFVEELVDEDCTDLPDTLRDLLLARYERLDEPAQHLLRLLSAGGVSVSHELLAHVYERDPAGLDGAAREAVLASVLVAEDNVYSFRHALVREAIHADLLPGERSRFHSRYAESLEGFLELEGGSTEIAEHWYAAHNPVKALPAALEAMKEARVSYAYATAAELGERALSLWQHLPDAQALAGMTHVDLLASTASALRNAGDGERSLAMVDVAIDECTDRTGLRFARLLRDKANYLANNGRPGGIPLLERALELVPEGADEVLRGNLLNTLAARFMLAVRLDRAVELAEQALEIAIAIGSPAQASVAANLAGVSRAWRGEVEAGAAQLERARELAEGDQSSLLRYRVNASDLLYHLGRYSEAIQLAEEGIARARLLGVERISGVILASNAVDPLIAHGDWDRAEALMDRSLALAPPAAFRMYLQRSKLWLLLWKGDPDAAAAQYRAWRSSMADPGESDLQVVIDRARVLAEISVARGEIDEAWGYASVLLAGEHRPLAGHDLPLLVVAAGILALRRARGDTGVDQDEAGLRALLESERYWPTWPVWSAQFEAELGAAGTGSGSDEWQLAVEAASSGPAHLRPYALYRLGQAQLAAGERVEARDSLRAARESAASLGAGLIVGLVDDYTARAGLSLGEIPHHVDAIELTARERQVLALIAQGCTNRQIGEHLFISAKTASVHVSAILRKLGATSRTEAAYLASRVPVG